MIPASLPQAQELDSWDVVNGDLRSTLDTWRRSPNCPSSLPWSFSSLTSFTVSVDTVSPSPDPSMTRRIVFRVNFYSTMCTKPRRSGLTSAALRASLWSRSSCQTCLLLTACRLPITLEEKSFHRPSSSGWRKVAPGLFWSFCAYIRMSEPSGRNRISLTASTIKGRNGTGRKLFIYSFIYFPCYEKCQIICAI